MRIGVVIVKILLLAMLAPMGLVFPALANECERQLNEAHLSSKVGTGVRKQDPTEIQHIQMQIMANSSGPYIEGYPHLVETVSGIPQIWNSTADPIQNGEPIVADDYSSQEAFLKFYHVHGPESVDYGHSFYRITHAPREFFFTFSERPQTPPEERLRLEAGPKTLEVAPVSQRDLGPAMPLYPNKYQTYGLTELLPFPSGFAGQTNQMVYLETYRRAQTASGVLPILTSRKSVYELVDQYSTFLGIKGVKPVTTHVATGYGINGVDAFIVSVAYIPTRAGDSFGSSPDMVAIGRDYFVLDGNGDLISYYNSLSIKKPSDLMIGDPPLFLAIDENFIYHYGYKTLNSSALHVIRRSNMTLELSIAFPNSFDPKGSRTRVDVQSLRREDHQIIMRGLGPMDFQTTRVRVAGNGQVYFRGINSHSAAESLHTFNIYKLLDAVRAELASR